MTDETKNSISEAAERFLGEPVEPYSWIDYGNDAVDFRFSVKSPVFNLAFLQFLSSLFATDNIRVRFDHDHNVRTMGYTKEYRTEATTYYEVTK